MQCPLSNSTEWKDLVSKVGEEDAYYARTLNNYDTPSPYKAKMLIDRYEGRPLDMNNYQHSLAYRGTADNNFDVVYDIDPFKEETVLNNPSEVVQIQNMMQTLSEKYRLPYQVMTPMKAKSLYDRIGREFSDSLKGFVYNGVVVLISGRYNLETVMHEFAHPFIEVLYHENREAFNGIFNQLMNTIEGKSIANDVRADSHYGDEDTIRKEILTRAIGRDNGKVAINENKFIEMLKSLYEWIKKSLARYKKFDIETSINANTTVKELADIIFSRKFDMPIKDMYVAGKLFELSEDLKAIEEEHDDIEQFKDTENKQKYRRKSNPSKIYGSNSEHSRVMMTTKKTSDEVIVDRVNHIFEESMVDKDTGTVIPWEDNKPYTYQQLINHYKSIGEEKMVRGTIKHALAEREMSVLHSERWYKAEAKIRQLLADHNLNREYVIGGLERQVNGMSVLKRFLKDELGLINKAFGNSINGREDDVIMSEVMSVNDDLGLGTSDDLIIKRPNGSYLFVDLKFGMAFGKINDHRPAKFAQDTNISMDPFYSSAMDLTKRVFMKKVKLGSAFKISGVFFLHITDRVNFQGQEHEPEAKKIKFSLQEHLIVLRRYLLSPEGEKAMPGINAKAEEWDKLGYFKQENYYTFSQELSDETRHVNKTLEEREDFFLNEIERYTTLLDSEFKSDNMMADEYRRRIVELTRGLMELRKDPAMDLQKLYKDTGLIRSYFGTQYEATHPYAQMAMEFYRKQKDLKTKAYNQYIEKFYKLERAMLNDTRADRIIRDIVGADPKKVFGMLYKKRLGENGTGFYLLRKGVDPEYDALTKAQKDMIDFVSETWSEEYDKVINHVFYESNGKKYTRKDAFTKRSIRNIPDKLYPGFLPRVEMTAGEVAMLSKTGIFSKKYLKTVWQNLKVSKYDDDIYIEKDDNGLSRIKYMPVNSANEDVEMNHSLNLEIMYKNFMGNLLDIQYMDPAISYARGIKSVLELEKKENPQSVSIKNTVRYLDSMIKLNMQGMRVKPDDITIMGTKFNPDKLINSVVNWTGMAILALHPFIASFNLALVVMFSHMKAVSNQMTSLITGEPEKIPYGLKDLAKADMLALSYLFDVIRGAAKTNKMELFLEMLQFRADNYDWKGRNSSLIIGNSKVLDKSNFYLLNQWGESFGSFILLASMLNHKKDEVTGKSIYDSYEVVDGVLVWKGGDQTKVNPKTGERGLRGRIYRGDDEDGNPMYEDLYGLNSHEISMMKNITRQMNGSYREDERTAIEVYGTSRLIMQFKRYMPVYLWEMYGSKNKDFSMEKYAKKGVVDDSPMLIPQKQMNQGMMWLTGRTLRMLMDITKISKLLGKAPTDKFTPEEWEKATYAWTTVATMLTYVFIAGLMGTGGDDEDDENRTKLQKRIDRLFLEDITKQGNPMDILRNLTSPVPSASFFFKAFSSWGTFIASAATDDRLENGLIRGQRQALNTIPLWSVNHEFDKYVFNSPKDGAKGIIDFIENWNDFEGRPK